VQTVQAIAKFIKFSSANRVQTNLERVFVGANGTKEFSELT